MSTTIETISEGGACFRLGDRLVEPRLNRLTRDGESIQLEIKAMDVLLCLARRAGEVVTRQEIVDSVWATEFISDNTLTHAIAELRNALGDDARIPTFIETIHRRGYRLITAVEPAVPEEPTTGTVARFPVSKALADDARNPYPGLAAFTESDAEFFFGREAEVAALWRKITTRRLLAVIGPSGVGKSSLLRAGLIPAAPEGWGVRICQPGEAPFSALARALAPDFSDDPDAIAALFELATSDAGLAVITRWRQRQDQALVIVDQFEEIFTQSPPEVQARFAELLGRLARETDTHVLLAMRDDFHYRCHEHAALAPVFADLTPIAQPAPGALARALALPARRCGYEFDDDSLVDEMVREVSEERAALPLLAFTAARLWEERDCDNRLLTREAYQRIGGIHGALAGHAEATVAAIGAGRLPVVREIFRNLVTAEGTRLTREVDDLLSVFDGGTETLPSRARRPKAAPLTLSSRASAGPEGRSESRDPHRLQTTLPTPGSLRASGDPSTRSLRSLAQDDRGSVAQDDRGSAGFTTVRESAAEVLRELVDARLLTSYEVADDDGGARRTVEIVHESLLAAWPRLVRWQTQDAEGALLRDQLRQAARTWDEHDRADDLLWAGSAYREYAVWRERYPGGLSELEESFAAAMTSLATRRRKRRRIAVAAGFAILLAVLAVVGTLWRRSVQETRRAEAEAARREAAQLLALGRLELADWPSRALAYAIASLEAADNEPARRFAVEALWRGPPALFLTDPKAHPIDQAWSADGRWLALGGDGLLLVDGETGQRRLLGSEREHAWGITPDGRRLITHPGSSPSTLNVRELPEGRLERTITYAVGEEAWPAGDRVQTRSVQADGSTLFRNLPLDGTTPEVLGRYKPPPDTHAWSIDGTGRWLLTLEGARVVQRRLDSPASSARLIGTHKGAFDVLAWGLRDRAVTFDQPDGGAAEVRIWDLPAARLLRTLSSPGFSSWIGNDLDPTGRHLAATAGGVKNLAVSLFDLDAPHGAEPTLLEGSYVPFTGGLRYFNYLHFTPDGSWLARVSSGTLTLWNLNCPRSIVLARQPADTEFVTFTQGGDLLLLKAGGAILKLWPHSPDNESGVSELWSRPDAFTDSPPGVDPAGRLAVVVEGGGRVNVIPLDGAKASTYELRLEPRAASRAGRLSPDGGLVALQVESPRNPRANAIRVVDLATGREQSLDTHPDDAERCAEPESAQDGLAFPFWLPDGRLASDGDGGLRIWDLTSGTSRRVRGCRSSTRWAPWLLATPDSRTIVLREAVSADSAHLVSSLSAFDLATGETREITSHGNRVTPFALDPSGTALVTGDQDGIVRVGRLSGETPHLLFGHTSPLAWVAVSPDGRRIASIDDDGNIRLWPMPDLSKPPLHTLPHDELLAKLKSLTNLRAVRDPDSDTGWKIEIGPFPGWREVPTW